VFARVGGVALVLPAERVERVAFHQASDIASLNLTPAGAAVRPKVLPSRHRPTSRHTAVDIVVDPRSEIRAPVTGIVKRAGEYSLYCKYQDAFAVISPDGHPELEVKMLHISGRRVRAGDRVVAGVTLLAKRSTKFAFGSQVDAFTAAPAWPHVHMEVTRLDVPSATPVTGPSTLAFSQCG
jgi:murein DD-endopeptidase MepM/ murein hydrolase activator NlpD